MVAMKVLMSISLAVLFLTAHANATPPSPPFVPNESFHYDCKFKLTRIWVDNSKRNSDVTIASTQIKYDPKFDTYYKPSVGLDKLEWKALSSASRSATSNPQNVDRKVSLSFARSQNTTVVKLTASISQASQSGDYLLNSYQEVLGGFEIGGEITADANVEERKIWINNLAPTGSPMVSSSFQVQCNRLK